MLFSKFALAAFTVAAGVEAAKKSTTSKTSKTTKVAKTTMKTSTGAASTAAASTAPTTTKGSSGGSSSGLQTVLPAAAGTSALKAAQTIAAGASFDGKGFLFDRSGKSDRILVTT